MVRNVHERVIQASPEVLGDLLDRLGRPGDRLWPSPAWVAMRFPEPLGVGVAGGHGPIRYTVSAYEPGRRVRCDFDPALGDGYHELTVAPAGAGRTLVRHELVIRPSGTMRLAWPLAIRHLHDAVLEDLLDNAERAATGAVASPARWSPWVRLLRRVEFRRPRKVPPPAGADLLAGSLDDVDLQDAWSVEREPGMSDDPQRWADAVFRDPPGWVGALFALRNALVGLVGIDRADGAVFATLARSEHEVLLGADDRHLDFRASVLVADEVVTLSTIVRRHGWRGRLYMAVVWPIHGRVVRGMLHRARRHIADASRVDTNDAGARVPATVPATERAVPRPNPSHEAAGSPATSDADAGVGGRV